MVTPDDGRRETFWVLIGFLFLAGILCAVFLAQACIVVQSLTTMESRMATGLNDSWAPWSLLILLLKILLSPFARFLGIPLEFS